MIKGVVKRFISRFRKWLRFKRSRYALAVFQHVVNKMENATRRVQVVRDLKNAKRDHASERRTLENRLSANTRERLRQHDKEYEGLYKDIKAGRGR